MESTDSIETYTYRTRKDLVNEKEEIKCNNIIKRYKKWLTLMMLQKKHERPQFKLTTNFWSSIQNINNSRLWIWKNKFII